jgi:hypothetical protein
MIFGLLPSPASIGRSISADVAGAIFRTALGMEASAAHWLVKGLVHAAGSLTEVSPWEGNGWFGRVVHDMFPVEGLVIAPMLFVATIGAVLRQDMRRLSRIWGVCLPLALVGGFAIGEMSYIGLSITDGLSNLVEANVDPHFGNDFANAVNFSVAVAAALPVVAVVGVVVIGAALAIWMELALRAACIQLAIFFMPLAFAGAVWPTTAHWPKRLLHVLGALLLAKPVIVGALCLGASALASGHAGLASMVTGAAILLMASFAPMVVLKLVPVAEASAIAHLQGVSRQPLHALERSVQRVVSVVSGVSAGAGQAPPSPSAAASADLMLQQMKSAAPGPMDLGPAGPPEGYRARSAGG